MKTKKQNKNNEKKNQKDRTFLIVVFSVFAICVLFLAGILLPEPMMANSRRRDAIRLMERDGAVQIVLSDPKKSGEGLFSSAEAVLSGSEAEEMRDMLLEIMGNTDFEKTEEATLGNWDRNVTVYVDEEKVRIYLNPSGLYLEHDGKRTIYTVEEEILSVYEDLYSKVTERLE